MKLGQFPYLMTKIAQAVVCAGKRAEAKVMIDIGLLLIGRKTNMPDLTG